jgi:putative two-component system response regulator
VEEQKAALIDFNTNLAQMVEDKTRQVVELQNALLSTMAELVEYRDEITGGHIERTQLYIKALMDAMKAHEIYKEEAERMNEALILQSCQLHDVGKIAVRDSILLKPGKLTTEEFDEMKKHTTFGERVINDLKKKTTDSDFLEYARIFAVTHHEKWNGNGYPKGLTGNEIPLLGRVMAIADVYDALVAARPYKDAMPHEKAVMIILEGAGSHFDPDLVHLFDKIHHEFQLIAATQGGTYE